MKPTNKRIRRPKVTREFIKSEFEKLGYTLITKTYTSSKQPLEVKCKKGHSWVVCWNNFSRGNRCRYCFIEKNSSKKLKKIVLRNPFFSISEAARILRVKDRDLRNHIYAGLLPGPTHTIKGSIKKFYKSKDIEKIESLIK